jgi:hypothetical protein
MRPWSLIFVVILSQCAVTDTPVALGPVRDEPLTVTATPVPLFPGDPSRTKLGALSFKGGWSLVGNASAFGGISSLRIEGNDVVGLTDAGGLIAFRIGQFGHVSDAHIFPMPAACGTGGDKGDRDSESLTHDPETGHWWIGLEGRNAICRTNNDFTADEIRVQPRAMADWPATGGPETLLRLADGRFIAIAERAPNEGPVRPMLVFDRDPTDPAAVITRLGYRPADGFSPTDAAELPDGRIVILERSFSLLTLFTARLAVIDPEALVSGDTIQGAELAAFAPPATPENFEGVAVTTEDGRTIIWIVSDNNFASWQRTLLMKFVLNEPAG